MFDLYVYQINLEGNRMAALSLLPPDAVDANGLPTEAVLGEVDPNRPEMTVDLFTANEAFLTFLHGIVAEYAHQLPITQKQAEKVQNGPVYVMDRRSINKGEKPPFEDCLGWYGVRDGEVLVETYNPSPSYKLLTNAGPIELEASIEKALLERVWAMIEPSAETP